MLVGGARVASFLLLRARYGVLVWALVPLLALLVFVGGLGGFVGRAARISRPEGSEGSDRHPSDAPKRER